MLHTFLKGLWNICVQTKWTYWTVKYPLTTIIAKNKHNSIFSKYNLNIFYKIYPNLNDYLSNNIKPIFSNNSYFKCQNPECKTCKFANTSQILNNKFNLPILIPNKTSCESIHCIYIIQCKKCQDKFYIGETSRKFSIRLSEHLRNIKKTISLKNNQEKLNNFLSLQGDSEIFYSHFTNDHNLITDISFQIFINNFNKYRLRLVWPNNLPWSNSPIWT